MPRNGSGSFSLAEAAFVPNTPISSSAVNSDLSDIGDALTGSLARDGQGGMTAVLPLANAGFTYLTDPNTGMRRTGADSQAISVGGIDIMTFTASASLLGGTFQINAGTSLVDASVSLRKLYHPTATSILLGSDSNAALVITGAANNGGGLIRLTVGSTTTFATGQSKTVSDVVGTTEANGTWTITVVDATHIDLQGSTFVNAYVSGGTIGGGFEQISLGAGLTLAGSVLSSTVDPALFPGYLSGLTLTAVGGTSTFGVSSGAATDSTDASIMVLASAYNKTTASWAVGSGNGSLDAGSIANGTWYHVHLIKRVDTGVTDILTSLSATAPTLPTNYTLFRRIGSVLTDGSAHYLAFVQFGDQFTWDVPVANIVAGAASTAPSAKTLSVPPGIVVVANMLLSFTNTAGAGNKWLVYPGTGSAQAADTPAGNYSLVNPVANQPVSGQFSVRTDTSRQVFSVASAAANNVIGIVTMGWIDNRGKS